MAKLAPVAVIGAGSFGTTLASLLAKNQPVILYSRKPEVVKVINTRHQHLNYTISDQIEATEDLAYILERCELVFPVVPSDAFRKMMQKLSTHLKPYHLLIHGTKGFDTINNDPEKTESGYNIDNIRTMSQVIMEESSVKRVGVISGPNLSKEIMHGLPSASIIASEFDEVVQKAKKALNSDHFKVFGSYDIIGTEFAGALKNMIAIGTGIIAAQGLGKNSEALFITRGLQEMIELSNLWGADYKTFFGTAGMGDLIATATSPDSRNYTFGHKLGEGSVNHSRLDDFGELVEGVRTVRIMYLLSKTYHLDTPIVDALHGIIYQNVDVREAIMYLMNYSYRDQTEKK